MHVTELPKEDVVKEACEQIYLAYRKYDSYNDPLWNGEMSFEEKIREILISNVRFLSSFGSYKKTYNIEDFAVTIHYSYSEDIEKDLFEIDLLHKNTSFTRRMNFVLNPFMERQIDYENRGHSFMPRTTFVLNWYFNNKKVWNCHTSEIFPEEDTKYTINSLLGSL